MTKKFKTMDSTADYVPPQSPILIQPGDTGFKTVGKAYNRFIWTFPKWKDSKKKIVNPDKVWGIYGKRMTPAQIKKSLKGAYLESDSNEEVNESYILSLTQFNKININE